VDILVQGKELVAQLESYCHREIVLLPWAKVQTLLQSKMHPSGFVLLLLCSLLFQSLGVELPSLLLI
jgi:hypothetical protein